MKQHTNTLAQMFTHGCQDTVISVATAALTACSSYIVALGSAQEVMILQVVIPPMLQVMVKCLHNGEEEVVVEALDVIQECCELEQPLVNEHIEVRPYIYFPL